MFLLCVEPTNQLKLIQNHNKLETENRLVSGIDVGTRFGFCWPPSGLPQSTLERPLATLGIPKSCNSHCILLIFSLEIPPRQLLENRCPKNAPKWFQGLRSPYSQLQNDPQSSKIDSQTTPRGKKLF